MFELFDAMVKPILCYAVEIWGNAFSEQTECSSIFCKIFKSYLEMLILTA